MCGVVLCASSNYISILAKNVTGKTYIDKKHGYLTGTLQGSHCGVPGYDCPRITVGANTDNVVSRIRAYESVYRTSTGKYIDGANTDWCSNKASCGIDVDLEHKYVGVKTTTYGTVDAIQEKAYAVHLTMQYTDK